MAKILNPTTGDYGLKSYFPLLHDLNTKWIESNLKYPYRVSNVYTLEAYQMKLQELYLSDFRPFYNKIAKLDTIIQIQIIEDLISEVKDKKSKMVSTFVFEGKDYNMFLRPEIIKRDESEIHYRNAALAQNEQYVNVFIEEMNQLIQKLTYLKNDLELKVYQGMPSINKNKGSLSFPYRKFMTHPDNLKDLRNGLINYKLILKCDQKNFDSIFSGNEVSGIVKWNGGLNELHYFVDKLNDGTLLKTVIKQQWLLTVKCFRNTDGSFLNKDKLRDATEIPANAEIIDRLIRLL